MSDFFRSRGFKVLVCVAVVLLGTMIASLLRNGTAGTVEGMVGLFVTPIRSVTSAVGDFFDDVGQRFRSRSDLQKQVDELTEQNAELMGQMADYEEMKRENEQLRELVHLQENNEDMTFVFAAVITHDTDPWVSTVGLDKGTLDGVSEGDPVVTKDSYLVGYVSKVGATWCTVTTILDPGTNVGVRLSTSREVGVTACDLELLSKTMCQVSYLPRDSSASRGELVLTSGLSGFYPEGLIVGTVDTVALSEDGLSSFATVTPSADPSALTDVFIITSFAGQGTGVGEGDSDSHG